VLVSCVVLTCSLNTLPSVASAQTLEDYSEAVDKATQGDISGVFEELAPDLSDAPFTSPVPRERPVEPRPPNRYLPDGVRSEPVKRIPPEPSQRRTTAEANNRGVSQGINRASRTENRSTGSGQIRETRTYQGSGQEMTVGVATRTGKTRLVSEAKNGTAVEGGAGEAGNAIEQAARDVEGALSAPASGR